MTIPVLLTIALPTYNRAEQAERQLRDMLIQTKNLLGDKVELLVSNNASPDDTDKRIKKIYDESPVFDYTVQSENIGGEANFSFLSHKAKGKFFWCIGDDDVLRPGTVKYVVDILKKWPDLGGIFLRTGGTAPSFHKIKWSNDTQLINNSFLRQYSIESLRLYPCSTSEEGEGDWCYLTKCIIRTKDYNCVVDLPQFKGNTASTFFASILSIHNRLFYYDDKVGCIRGGVSSPLTWWYEDYSMQFITNITLGIQNLKMLGFTSTEINVLLSASGRLILKVLALRYGARNEPIEDSLKLIDKLKNEYGFHYDNQLFCACFKPEFLLTNTVVRISMHKLPLSKYHEKKKDIAKVGIQPSYMREIKWYLKYFVYLRIKYYFY